MSDSSNSSPRRLVVLGSTGSIGVNALAVVDHLNATTFRQHPIQVVGLAAGANVQLLIAQARATRCPAVAIADPAARGALEAALPGVVVYAGTDAALKLTEASQGTDVMAAVVGAAGLPATIAAVRAGMRISLANKETLVAAGAVVCPLAREHNAPILPVDSEHSAIFQCLAGQPRKAVKRIVLTASGGPFRKTPTENMRNATVAEALNHPTWKMGPKITIDSATMMNKALEVVEAHWLFDLPASQIQVIIHPQSVAHSFVEFDDHSILAQLGTPDMKMPIQYALTYPERAQGSGSALDWTQLRQLDFEQPDKQKFPSLDLAYQVINAGGSAGATFNAANEAAVQAFLDGRIRFGRIVELVADALGALPCHPVQSIDDVLAADAQARDFVQAKVG